MQLLEELPPWTANEFVAAKQIEAAILGSLFAIILAMRANLVVAAIAFGLIFVFWQSMGTAKIRDDAKRRVTALKRRLPYAIDLMALMMEAGAGFQESLQAIVQENRDHPLGEELDGVLSEVELGRTRREALEKLQERLNDDDIKEIVFSIIKGEELGTPLAVILRTQADQLRMKRSHWAEKAAAQAQVQIAFPGLIVMVACLLVIVAPFVLKAFNAL
jgi:tight adherence protein C